MHKILITDAHHRKVLAAVRSLGTKNIEIIAASNRKINPSRMSKHCDSFIVYPDPAKKPDKFIEFLVDYLKGKKVDLLLPMDDVTVELISENLNSFNDIKIPIPDYNTFMKARDKSLTIKKAIENNIPAPNTYFINNLTEVKNFKDEIEYPTVIKPRVSSGSRGITYINSKEELIEKYNLVHREFKFPMLQEYIPQTGRKFQVLLLIDKNKNILASTVQELLRQFPVGGGPGTLWKTIDDKELEELSIKLIKSLDWYGIACVEFITDPRTGEPKLMEINPRFWGTLNLSLKVGVNFPELLIKMEMGEEIKPVINESFEEYCQWLLPGDFFNFVFNKDRFNQTINYFFNKPKKFHYAILSKDDPLPVLGAVLSYIIDLFNKEKLKNIFNRGK
ncbi:MAG: ATP-grasp domain-containing protein [bacterium]